MPENIQIIEHTCDLPFGAMQMIQIDNDTDAIDYAAGRTAYLYHSQIIDACYLFVPVSE